MTEFKKEEIGVEVVVDIWQIMSTSYKNYVLRPITGLNNSEMPWRWHIFDNIFVATSKTKVFLFNYCSWRSLQILQYLFYTNEI